MSKKIKPLRVFIGLCGRNANGFESSGRGESRWAQSLARCLSEAGHEIYMAPDTEEAGWGTCVQPPNVHLYQAWQKHLLNNVYFDIAIYSSWQDEQYEANYIHADKYLWGIMGWKQELMKDGYFKDNDYVMRWVRQDLPQIPYPINFKDRCFLLTQPFGKECEPSRFKNKRIGWVAKEAFLDTTDPNSQEASRRHIFAVVDACKQTGASLAIFSCGEFNPKVARKIEEWGILDKLREINNVVMYPSLPFLEYQKELRKCSVIVPVGFAGSVQEGIIAGVIPLLYKDHMFSDHPWIKDVASDLTFNTISRAQSESDNKIILSEEAIKNRLVELLTDECLYEQFLYRLRPMVIDNFDNHALKQLEDIMAHEVKGKNLRT